MLWRLFFYYFFIHFGVGWIARPVLSALLPASIVVAEGDQAIHPELAHVAERHRWTGRVSHQVLSKKRSACWLYPTSWPSRLSETAPAPCASFSSARAVAMLNPRISSMNGGALVISPRCAICLSCISRTRSRRWSLRHLSHKSMKPNETGPPMTLGNMCELK